MARFRSICCSTTGSRDLCVVTPACALPGALNGTGIFDGYAMPSVRALGTIPQDDRLLLAVDPAFGVRTMAELREKRPPLLLAASWDNGYNFIGFAAAEFL